MADPIREVSSQSWGSRLMGSIKGILVGFVFVLIAAYALFWNEGRAVRRSDLLDEGAGLVVPVAADRMDPAQMGNLVLVSGPTVVEGVLTDPQLGPSASGIHFRRKVSIYQWRERSESKTEKKLGGSTETVTTTTYEKTWQDRLNPSTQFKEPVGHENPAVSRFSAWETSAPRVTVGAFELSPAMVGSLRNYQKWPVTPEAFSAVPATVQNDAKLIEGAIYLSGIEGTLVDPASPKIGDLKIEYELAGTPVVTAVGKQGVKGLEPYATKKGGSIELIQNGTQTKEAFFQAEQDSNETMTWAVRIGGFLFMWMGFGMTLRLFSVLADVVPFFGSLVSIGTSFAAFFAAAGFSAVVVAVGWFSHRPILSLSLIALAVGAVIAWKVMSGKKSASVAASVPLKA